QLLAFPTSGLDRTAKQKGLVAVETERIGTILDAVKVIVAERVKLLVRTIFSIDNQSLVIGNVVAFPQILEQGRHFRFKSFGKKLVGDVLVLFVLAGDDVERALAMTCVHADHRREGIDLHFGKERPALDKFMA